MTKMIAPYGWRGNAPVSVDDAVTRSIRPSDPYATSGELELMRHEIDRLASVVGVLSEILSERGLARDDDLARLTGYEFEAAEE